MAAAVLQVALYICGLPAGGGGGTAVVAAAGLCLRQLYLARSHGAGVSFTVGGYTPAGHSCMGASVFLLPK